MTIFLIFFLKKLTGGGGVVDSGRDVTIFSAISGGVLVTEGTGDSRLFFLIFEFYKMNKKIQVTMGKQIKKESSKIVSTLQPNSFPEPSHYPNFVEMLQNPHNICQSSQN